MNGHNVIIVFRNNKKLGYAFDLLQSQKDITDGEVDGIRKMHTVLKIVRDMDFLWRGHVCVCVCVCVCARACVCLCVCVRQPRLL